jgi:VWFA-related protein
MRSGSICPEHRIRSAWWVVAAATLTGAAVYAPLALAQSTGQPATPRRDPPRAVFRSATELVVLPVTVVDPAGRAVVDAPLDLMLLLDTSDSMSHQIDYAREAAVGLVRELREGDRAAVLLFSERVHIAQPTALLEQAIRGARLSGGTALHEALYIALRDLARERREPIRFRRQALVVLSDGKDTTSKRMTFEDVLAEARRSAVTVFTIMSGNPGTPTVWLRDSEQLGVEYMLRLLAEETGGRAFAPARHEDLASTYSQIAVELGRQYWLAYAPGPGRSGFRRVTVQLESRPGLRARTRSGYYAASSRAAAPSTLRSYETAP